jgi:predicted phosphodiesterase
MEQRQRRWDDIKDEERAHLLRLKNTGQLTKEVFRSLNLRMAYDSLRRKLNEYRPTFEARQQAAHAVRTLKMPPSPTKAYKGYEVLDGNDFIVISDVEIPDHFATYLELALLMGMAHGIRRLIIAGDFVATDQDALNSWVTMMLSDDLDYEETIRLTKDILLRFSAWFEEIIIIEGNHDDRIARVTKGQVNLGLFLAGDKVRYSRYHYLWVRNSEGKYTYICHPRQYSANAVALGQRLYNTKLAPDRTKPIAIILGHTHQAQSGASPDGYAQIYALGTLREAERTKYISITATTHHAWINGFMMIRRGYYYNLTQFSDWKFWLGEYYPAPEAEEVSP